MKAVILAGGVRSGLEVPGSNLPRALWPFPSDPLVTEVIRFLRRSEIADIAICANGKTRMIASELSSAERPWRNIHYAEDVMPRGPAGCLRDLKEWLGDGDCLAIQGTGFYDFDLAAMVASHQQSRSAITVGAKRCNTGLEPAGVYLLNTSTLDLVNAVGYQDIKEQLLPKALEKGLRVRSHALAGDALLIHSVPHYLDALTRLIPLVAQRQEFPMREVASNVWAHPAASIAEGAKLSGPVWLDRDARVHANAVIVGPAVVGVRAQVGQDAVIHRAVLMPGVAVPPRRRVVEAVATPATQFDERDRSRPDAPRGENSRMGWAAGMVSWLRSREPAR